MRFMMIVKASKESEAGVLPSKELMAEMEKFNEEMRKTGVMLAADGLHPSSKGVRLTFTQGKPIVTDGPFAETKELIAGFWMINVSSAQAALDWAKRIPFTDGVVEIRQVFEPSDFPVDRLPSAAAKREQAGRTPDEQPKTAAKR